MNRNLVAKFQNPSGGVQDDPELLPFMHITWSTGLLGVIDDMFINTEPDLQQNVTVVNIMSQLRIGRSDFDVNYSHVSVMYKCLNG